jgi:hypothetical protein
MANKILHKRSNILGDSPDLSALDFGELAINTKDGYLFFKKSSESGNYLCKFVDAEGQSHVLNVPLSGFIPQFGNNTISEVFASILGGSDNIVDGAASSIVNGENNKIESDFSSTINGINNNIVLGADYSFIAGGQNNKISHSNVFTLGSNLSSHADNFTYVNNISAQGALYGDGSNLTGIVAGDTVATTLVRSNSSNWDNTYTTVLNNSATWGQGGGGQYDTFISSNSANWFEPVKRFEYVDSNTSPVSYSGVAVYGSGESDSNWTIKKIFYTTVGSISATKTAENVAWVNRVSSNYI